MNSVFFKKVWTCLQETRAIFIRHKLMLAIIFLLMVVINFACDIPISLKLSAWFLLITTPLSMVTMVVFMAMTTTVSVKGLDQTSAQCFQEGIENLSKKWKPLLETWVFTFLQFCTFFLMFIIPGFYIGLLYAFSSIAVITEDSSVNALEISKAMVKPRIGKLIGFSLLLFILYFPVIILISKLTPWLTKIIMFVLMLFFHIFLCRVYLKLRNTDFDHISSEVLHKPYPTVFRFLTMFLMLVAGILIWVGVVYFFVR